MWINFSLYTEIYDSSQEWLIFKSVNRSKSFKKFIKDVSNESIVNYINDFLSSMLGESLNEDMMEVEYCDECSFIYHSPSKNNEHFQYCVRVEINGSVVDLSTTTKLSVA